MAASIDFTISFEAPDNQGWIVARVLEVPGAMSQGRTRDEARENALDALRTVLTPDEELEGRTPDADREQSASPLRRKTSCDEARGVAGQ